MKRVSNSKISIMFPFKVRTVERSYRMRFKYRSRIGQIRRREIQSRISRRQGKVKENFVTSMSSYFKRSEKNEQLQRK